MAPAPRGNLPWPRSSSNGRASGGSDRRKVNCPPSGRRKWIRRNVGRPTEAFLPVNGKGRSAALHLAEELAALLAAGLVGLLDRGVDDLGPVVADFLDREPPFAQIDAFGLDDAGQRERAGAGGRDAARGRRPGPQAPHPT